MEPRDVFRRARPRGPAAGGPRGRRRAHPPTRSRLGASGTSDRALLSAGAGRDGAGQPRRGQTSEAKP